MTPLASAISGALIHFVWQGSLIGLTLWAALFALRKKSAHSRYIAGCLALVLLVTLPVCTALFLYARSGGAAASAPADARLTAVQGEVERPPAWRGEIWPAVLQRWALPVWSMGVLLFSLRLLVGYSHAFRLRRRGTPAGEEVLTIVARIGQAMGLPRPIRVLISGMTDSPSVVGWLRPVILLPAAALTGLTPLQLEAILAHEIGHIRRYDYLVNIFQMVVETLLFYHPAVWWISARLRTERELCCDDVAVRVSGDALRYARALTVLEKLRLTAPGTAMAGTGGPLLYRIQRLMGSGQSLPSRSPVLLALSLGGLALALNVGGLRGQERPGVTVDLGSAALIHRTAVEYPEAALKAGISGSVQVEVKLDASGGVADARVLTGPEELRRSALQSVLNWHFSAGAARTTRIVTINYPAGGAQVEGGEAELREAIIHLKLDRTKAEWQRRQAEAVLPGVVLTTRGFLEGELAALSRKLAEVTAAGSATDQAKIRAELNALREKLKTIRLESQREPFAGRIVSRISTPAMSDSVRADLLARLPLREGDRLESSLLEQTRETMRTYDGHLLMQMTLDDQGRVQLEITGPPR